MLRKISFLCLVLFSGMAACQTLEQQKQHWTLQDEVITHKTLSQQHSSNGRSGRLHCQPTNLTGNTVQATVPDKPCEQPIREFQTVERWYSDDRGIGYYEVTEKALFAQDLSNWVILSVQTYREDSTGYQRPRQGIPKH